MKDVTAYRECIGERAYGVLERANTLSQQILRDTNEIVSDYLDGILDLRDVCFVAVGSVGRLEALEASDLDLIPVLIRQETSEIYKGHDKKLRKTIGNKLQIKVSEGKDLTQAVLLKELIASASIGGDDDDRAALTRRILILTEGRHAGGEYSIDDVRKAILDAYAKQERTSGRHVLSLINDIARYYRTLCIEYKAKIDVGEKDWCTRNMKLRHSRKFWYLANILSCCALANKNSSDIKAYGDKLLEGLNNSPIVRVLISTNKDQTSLIREILECYAWFLDFMSDNENREALAQVSHAGRYEVSLENPFVVAKRNSDLMHKTMMEVIFSLDPGMRDRVFDWFLL